MKKMLCRGAREALLLAAALVGGERAYAGLPTPEVSLAERVALADGVFVGKVKALEDALVEAAPLLKVRGAGMVSYRVAVVRVDAAMVGVKAGDEVRVAFDSAPRLEAKPGSGIVGRARLEADQEGIFFLKKHPDQPFYVARSAVDFLDKAKTKDFDKVVVLVRRCVRLQDDPDAGLRSKSIDDRLLTAALLVYRYRTVQWVCAAAPKTRPVDAAQSKLILEALAEGPFVDEVPELGLARWRLFFRLGLTRDDGWVQPRKLKETAPAARKWLTENAATYRLQRYVPDDTPDEE